jgi:8-oxo-dGTP diphosphatase
MELWDILDEDGNKTGKTVERGKPMKQDEYHLVVHVWIKNSSGEYLISKRTPNKTFPNMWETTGGSAIVGDDSLQAALREVKEEIGIDLSPERGKCLFRLKRQHKDFPDFTDVWLFNEDVDIRKVVYQPEEVCGAKWATLAQIRALIEAGEFVDVFTYLDELFELK